MANRIFFFFFTFNVTFKLTPKLISVKIQSDIYLIIDGYSITTPVNAIVFDFPCSFEEKNPTRKSIKIRGNVKNAFKN